MLKKIIVSFLIFQVIWCTFLSILVPILIVGSFKKPNERFTLGKCLLGICTAVIRPIQLQFELVATKLVKKKLLIFNDVTMAPNFQEVVTKIRCLEEEILRHTRIHLGLETMFQVTANTIFLLYAQSTTRTRQGLSALFDKDSNFFMEFSVPPELVIGTLLAINFLSFIKVQMNGMIEGYASNYSILGKVVMLISIICATLVRISSMTLYFSTTLGLFDLLGHYQGANYHIE